MPKISRYIAADILAAREARQAGNKKRKPPLWEALAKKRTVAQIRERARRLEAAEKAAAAMRKLKQKK